MIKSFLNIGFSKQQILYNIIQAISLPSFIGLGCLDQLLLGGGGGGEGGGHLHALKKSSLYKVKSPLKVNRPLGIEWERMDRIKHAIFDRKCYSSNPGC